MPHMQFRHLFSTLSVILLLGCGTTATIDRNGGKDGNHLPAAKASGAKHSVGTCVTDNLEADMVNSVNRIRAAGAVCGGVSYPPVKPLRWNAKLQQAASVHSEDMASHNFFAHKSATTGFTMVERMRIVGYNYQSVRENIGAGPNTVAEVLDMWVASPGHCVTLMTASLVELGASCKSNSNSLYKTYWTLKAASPL
jgi:uncharacterized protein YkwD